CDACSPGTGKTHLAIALGIRACVAGQRVAFATATEWIARLGDPQRVGRFEDELKRLGRIPLLVVDEIGALARAAPLRLALRAWLRSAARATPTPNQKGHSSTGTTGSLFDRT
ncbi:MAG: ATP-binding protein, partial [Solirubrobacteraceae bacterium]